MLFADDLNVLTCKVCWGVWTSTSSYLFNIIWCGENYQGLNIHKTKIILITHKITIHLYYCVIHVSVLDMTVTKKFLHIMLDSKLHFYYYVYYVYPQSWRLFGLIHYTTHNLCSLDSPIVLYTALIWSELEYAFVGPWHNSGVHHWLLTTEAQIYTQVSPVGFVVITISPLFHIHSCIIWGMDNGPISGPIPHRNSLAWSQQ